MTEIKFEVFPRQGQCMERKRVLMTKHQVAAFVAKDPIEQWIIRIEDERRRVHLVPESASAKSIEADMIAAWESALGSESI